MADSAALILDIYSAALEESPWQGVVARMADSLNASHAFMFTTFAPLSEGGVGVFHELPEAGIRAFMAETADVDVWYQELVRRHGALRTGFTCTTDGLLPDRVLHRTRFFADYLRPGNIGRCLTTIVGDGSSLSTPLMPLCFYRPFGSKPFSKRDQSTLKQLQPHLTQAMLVRRKLDKARTSAAELAIHCVSVAVVVLARDRKILFANPAADELLAQPGAVLVRDGRLRAAEPSQTAVLDSAVAACAAYCLASGPSMPVRLSGPVGAGVVAGVVPPPARIPAASRACAVAILLREGGHRKELREIAAALYRLTAAEAELVAALSEGATLEAHAERRGIRLTTAKSQLLSVFGKTGTNRQAQLMRLMYSIAH